MREVQASDAKTHLPQLLDDVERGETILITRHGRPVARLVPEATSRRDDLAAVVAAMRSEGKRRGHIAIDELLSSRDEGRRG